MLGGGLQKIYNISVKTTAKSRYNLSDNTKIAEVTEGFKWTLKDPCVDAKFITINKPASLPTFEFLPELEDKAFPALPAFSWTAKPFNHQLCGALKVTAQLIPTGAGASLILNPESLIAYDEATRVLTLKKGDVNLENQKNQIYKLEAYFAKNIYANQANRLTASQ